MEDSNDLGSFFNEINEIYTKVVTDTSTTTDDDNNNRSITDNNIYYIIYIYTN